ncbi:MAG: PIN domain-containing protein [Candidatus Diapherotrites archaeon]
MEYANKVAVDTNMLMAINQFGIDFFNEVKGEMGNVEFIVPKQVMRELDGLAKEGKKNLSSVKIAKELMEKENVLEVVTSVKGTDDALVELAGKGAIIATNDAKLKARIREIGGKIIFLRQKKFLEIM